MYILIAQNGFFMSKNILYYTLLNITVLIWGFTGVLGKEISLPADKIVFFRTGIAFISLLIFSFFYSVKQKLTPNQKLRLLFTGVIVGSHWYLFFYAIKISNVSIAVICMSSSALFTAILEPLLFKKKPVLSEFILGLIIIAGMVLIIGFEPHYLAGILIGLLAAFLASLFSVLNARHVQKMPSISITKIEMLGGFLTLFIILLINGSVDSKIVLIGWENWGYLLFLGIICTTIAFLISVWLMKYLSPFTVSMGLNMEPIYAILIVLAIDYYRGEKGEIMSVGFYIGTIIIILSIFANGYQKMKKRKN